MSSPPAYRFPQETRPADRVRDALAERFGKDAVPRASLVGRHERQNPEFVEAESEVPGRRRARS